MSLYQHADVIVQQPFKHACWQAFNKYNIKVITKQPKVGGNMYKLKPHICAFFYVT